MKNKKLLLGILLFILGFIGILSILTMEIQLPEELKALLEVKFSPDQIKLLMLVNPTIYLIIATVLGVLFFEKVGLSAPLLEKLVGQSSQNTFNLSNVKYGILGGIISGILLSAVATIATSLLTEEFELLNSGIQPSILSRFLYGGITEEILLRFGFMTFVVWLSSKITKSISALNYWIGILISAVLFAISHFPVVYGSIPEPSLGILVYVLIGNSLGGIIFGWLYWKKGLETAFMAHIFTHLVLLLSERL